MKKLAIAGASVVLAAMPVVGVFAATSSQFTDTLNVTVKGGCTLTNSQDASTPGTYTNGDRAFTVEIAPGNVGYLNANASGAATSDEGTVSIACNSSDSNKTWTVAVDVTGLTYTPTSGDPITIAGGAQTTGATSGWAIKSNAQASSGNFTSDPFATYATAADGTFLSATADKTATFNPSYQVYVASSQTPGSYTGTAVYNITLSE